VEEYAQLRTKISFEFIDIIMSRESESKVLEELVKLFRNAQLRRYELQISQRVQEASFHPEISFQVESEYG
jgi:hypothetical protein